IGRLFIPVRVSCTQVREGNRGGECHLLRKVDGGDRGSRAGAAPGPPLCTADGGDRLWWHDRSQVGRGDNRNGGGRGIRKFQNRSPVGSGGFLNPHPAGDDKPAEADERRDCPGNGGGSETPSRTKVIGDGTDDRSSDRCAAHQDCHVQCHDATAHTGCCCALYVPVGGGHEGDGREANEHGGLTTVR